MNHDNRIAILAGSYRQGVDYARSAGLGRQDVIIVGGVHDIIGRRRMRARLVGTWYEREDAQTLRTMMIVRGFEITEVKS